MSKYSKHSDIEALMTKAEADVLEIEKQYKGYLTEQKVPDSLLVDIKSCLGNMRSSLDYLWCKVPDVGSSAHFPIANSQSDFLNKITGIDKIFSDIVGKWQSYNGDQWLSDFGYIRNKNEHLMLIPQIRRETKRVSVFRGEGSVSWGEGVTFGGGVSVMGVPIDPATQMPIPNGVTETRVEIWVDFLFDGSSISVDFPKNISVLAFLKQSLSNTQKIISELEKIV